MKQGFYLPYLKHIFQCSGFRVLQHFVQVCHAPNNNMNLIRFIYVLLLAKDDAKFEAQKMLNLAKKNALLGLVCLHGLNVSASALEEHW
jgi:hypothetical protein